MAIEQICAELDTENFDAYELVEHAQFLSSRRFKKKLENLNSCGYSQLSKETLISTWVKYWKSIGQSLEEAPLKLLSKFIFALVSQTERLREKGFLVSRDLINTQFYPKFCVRLNKLNEHDIDVGNSVACFYQSTKLVHICPELRDAVCDQDLSEYALQLSSVLISHGTYSSNPSQDFSNFILACGHRAQQGMGFRINPKQLKELADKFSEVIERSGKLNQDIANFMWGITLYSYIHNENILEGGYLNKWLNKIQWGKLTVSECRQIYISLSICSHFKIKVLPIDRRPYLQRRLKSASRTPNELQKKLGQYLKRNERLTKRTKSIELEYFEFITGFHVDIMIKLRNDKKVILEIDGAHHYQGEYLRSQDYFRDQLLKELGDYFIIRVKNLEAREALQNFQAGNALITEILQGDGIDSLEDIARYQRPLLTLSEPGYVIREKYCAKFFQPQQRNDRLATHSEDVRRNTTEIEPSAIDPQRKQFVSPQRSNKKTLARSYSVFDNASVSQGVAGEILRGPYQRPTAVLGSKLGYFGPRSFSSDSYFRYRSQTAPPAFVSPTASAQHSQRSATQLCPTQPFRFSAADEYAPWLTARHCEVRRIAPNSTPGYGTSRHPRLRFIERSQLFNRRNGEVKRGPRFLPSKNKAAMKI